jgi:predicted DCC family thiol-disulfide oxidoreductase YuxK
MDQPILLYDGNCNLCRNIVRWIVANDLEKRLRFATLQSSIGSQLLAQHQLPPAYESSAVLIHGGRRWLNSDGVLQSLRHLHTPWRFARAGRLIPRLLRDWGYRRVSRNRSIISRLFGTTHEPWVPPPNVRDRFLDAAEHKPGTTCWPGEH